jgi:CMP-N-acetylneuraminic acid synthetase
MRDPKLASDSAKMPPVILDIIDQLKCQGRNYQGIILLQPTCPFRTPEDIQLAISQLVKEKSPAVISFTQVGDMHPARMYRLNENKLNCLEPEFEFTNRQQLPATYIRNGMIYAVTMERFLATESFFHSDAYPLVIAQAERSVNIDEMTDFYLAEALLKNKIV